MTEVEDGKKTSIILWTLFHWNMPTFKASHTCSFEEWGPDGARLEIPDGWLRIGVAAKLKQLCPSLVPIWCVAHRLELSAFDSII